MAECVWSSISEVLKQGMSLCVTEDQAVVSTKQSQQQSDLASDTWIGRVVSIKQC